MSDQKKDAKRFSGQGSDRNVRTVVDGVSAAGANLASVSVCTVYTEYKTRDAALRYTTVLCRSDSQI